MHKAVEVTECSKCGRVVAEPKELIRILKRSKLRKTKDGIF